MIVTRVKVITVSTKPRIQLKCPRVIRRRVHLVSPPVRIPRGLQ